MESFDFFKNMQSPHCDEELTTGRFTEHSKESEKTNSTHQKVNQMII